MEDRPRWVNVRKSTNTRSSRIMSPGHRNRINCIDRHREHRCTNAADCDAAGRGWKFAADKFGDGKFPIFVSRSRRDRPHSELMATVSSAAAAEMNPAAEQMVRTKYPKPFVVRSVIFCECGQANPQNVLPKIYLTQNIVSRSRLLKMHVQKCEQMCLGKIIHANRTLLVRQICSRKYRLIRLF